MRWHLGASLGRQFKHQLVLTCTHSLGVLPKFMSSRHYSYLPHEPMYNCQSSFHHQPSIHLQAQAVFPSRDVSITRNCHATALSGTSTGVEVPTPKSLLCRVWHWTWGRKEMIVAPSMYPLSLRTQWTQMQQLSQLLTCWSHRPSFLFVVRRLILMF